MFTVPLAIFKREKEIARRLEFDGLYVVEQPEDDDIKAYWDKLVISAKSFPVNYWDKFVKKKVRQKYSESYDFDAISNLLGMEKTSLAQEEAPSGFINNLLSVDWHYLVSIFGVYNLNGLLTRIAFIVLIPGKSNRFGRQASPLQTTRFCIRCFTLSSQSWAITIISSSPPTCWMWP